MRPEHVDNSVRASKAAPPSASFERLTGRTATAKAGSQAACRYWLQRIALVCVYGLPLCVALEGSAFAEPSEYRMAVFALETDDLQDQFAVQLAQQLRAALDERTDYALQDTRVSLMQLSLAQNCNTADAKCLAAIAQSLGVDGFVFGKVTHEGGVPVAVLRRYDLWSQHVDRSALASFSSNSPRREELDRSSAKLLNDLLGPAPKPKGTQTELASPALPKLAKPGELAVPDDDVTASRVAGYALLGGAVVSAGASVLSFIEVRRAERNRDYERYRLAVGARTTNVGDVCEEANAGRRYGLDASSFREAKGACSRGTAFEILQFVFIGGAVVSGGLAAYFLTSSHATKERPALGSENWSLHPTIARKGFGLGARMRF
jgi:hypothetical protein